MFNGLGEIRSRDNPDAVWCGGHALQRCSRGMEDGVIAYIAIYNYI